MFRNHYDSDVTVWSPNGRLYQVEYAMEAVRQGAPTVALKNKDYAALFALRRTSEDTSILLSKIMPIDTHVGISIAGLGGDGRVMCQMLRTECLSYRHSYNTPYPVRRLVTNMGNKLQMNTQRYDRRPLGVGLLLAGYDEQGPHVFQIMPSANVFSCKAMAIGSRSHSARSYLERNLSNIQDCTKDELIVHGIQAVRMGLGVEEPKTESIINVAIVGQNQAFKVFSDEESANYVKMAKASGALPEMDKDEPDSDQEEPMEQVEPVAAPTNASDNLDDISHMEL